MQTLAYGADHPKDAIHAMTIPRREVGEHDVGMEILYCGVCHTDIHAARNDFGFTPYPVVPGHEILGRVTKTGAKVSKFKVGDLAGIGCMVNSCQKCDECTHDQEHFCPGTIFTYSSMPGPEKTYGGYSSYIVVDQHFALKVPEKFTQVEGVPPLFCAGITTYSPLKRYQDKVIGKKVGVIGLGGLGHMGVKFAAAMGAEVTVFSTSPHKEADAKKLGAHHFVLSKDENAMKSAANSLDFILDTVAADHEIIPFIGTLRDRGVYVLVGVPPSPFLMSAFPLLMGHRIVTGSKIGGIKETQEMIDFCAEHNIVADVEVIQADQINEAFERTLKSDVKYRFVIDIKTLHQ